VILPFVAPDLTANVACQRSYLARIAEELGEDGAPRWNFHKYLVAPDGSLAGAWPSRVRPESREITAEIEKLLPPR
jgi:glutathione peroxidase-family protein